MKKIMVLMAFLTLISLSGYSQDSTKIKTKKAARSIKRTSKKVTSKTGKAIDTAVKKTGTFVKKTTNTVASAITRTPDKSIKGPNGEMVYNGPRGGKYYINKAGSKVYLKKDKVDPKKM